MVCVVLCAGESRRFGREKAFEKLRGKTLVERVVDVARHFGRVRVVVNPENEEKMREILEGVEIVVNEMWKEGLATSVKKGLENVKEDVLIFLCDMPLITVEEVEEFLKRALDSDGKILFPTWNGKKGFPTLLREEAIELSHLLKGDEGFKRVCEELESVCVGIAIEGAGFYEDIDTPDDLRRLSRRCEDGVHEL